MDDGPITSGKKGQKYFERLWRYVEWRNEGYNKFYYM